MGEPCFNVFGFILNLSMKPLGSRWTRQKDWNKHEPSNFTFICCSQTFMICIKYWELFLLLKVQPLVWPVQGAVNPASWYCICSADFSVTHSLSSGVSSTTGWQSNSNRVSWLCYSCICSSIYIIVFAIQWIINSSTELIDNRSIFF